jgi:transposase-like protein
VQITEKPKRRYFSKSQKLEILNQISSGDMKLTELARKFNIHPVTLYQWKRKMGQNKNIEHPQIHEILMDLEKLKAENENLKKAVGDLVIDKQILKTAIDILKKDQREEELRLQKKLSKK